MKIILILCVIFPLALVAASTTTKEKELKKTTQMEQTAPDKELSPEKMNTSPTPVPEDTDLIQREEEAPYQTGPYDKDGNYTLPKKKDTSIEPTEEEL